jgi:hypothetical protein
VIVNIPPVAYSHVLDSGFIKTDAWNRIQASATRRPAGSAHTFRVQAEHEDLVDLGNYLAGVLDVLSGLSREERGIDGGQELRACKQALTRITRATGWGFDPYTRHVPASTLRADEEEL